MFNPQIILAAILALITALGLGFYSGQDWANTKVEARRAKELAAQQIAMDKQRAHADALSNALSIAEGRIITQTVEVIKYVPKVTTGAPCLNAATVSLLQPGANPGLHPPPGALTPEGAAPASSDTDIAGWIATANQHYETCAVRLNALVDFETHQ